MTDTFYLHLEFTNKNFGWSINLPFLCTKCGVCCKLEDFLSAGEIYGKPEVTAKVKVLFEELGKMWEADETKYDDYIAQAPCPFLINKGCSIYEFRPLGCRLFPQTTFGMQTQDCQPLGRFKKQCIALEKGRAYKETYHFTGKTSDSTHCAENIKRTNFTKKQYQACIVKLRQSGITDDELTLFSYFNGKNKE